jgi:hypothetical protein
MVVEWLASLAMLFENYLCSKVAYVQICYRFTVSTDVLGLDRVANTVGIVEFVGWMAVDNFLVSESLFLAEIRTVVLNIFELPPC